MKQLLIIGDTLAGWTAAAALSQQFKGNKDVSIQLIDSKQHSQLSGGNRAEVLSPASLGFHRMLGINERHFVATTGATFQLANHYQNHIGNLDDFMHVYGEVGARLQNFDFHQQFVKHHNNLSATKYDEYSMSAQMAKNHLFVHPAKQAQSILSTVAYGLHVDRFRYQNYLRNIALKNKVQGGLLDDYKVISDKNVIQYIEVAGGERLKPDLFIDCTADGRIMNSLNENSAGWSDGSNDFPWDSVLRVSTKSRDNIPSATQIQVLADGILKSIPLQDRIEHELYFSAKLTDEQTLMHSLHAIIAEDFQSDPEIAILPNRVRRDFWQSNCITLGRAAGLPNGLFLGEAHLAQSASMRLFDLFPQTTNTQFASAEYNRLCNEEYLHLRDFQLAYVYLNAKSCAAVKHTSDFWKQALDLDLPAELQHKLELFNQCGKIPKYESETFENDMWVSLFIGLGCMPQSYAPLLALQYGQAALEKIHRIRQIISHTLTTLPTHAEYLQHYCQPDTAPSKSRSDSSSSRVYL